MRCFKPKKIKQIKPHLGLEPRIFSLGGKRGIHFASGAQYMEGIVLKIFYKPKA